MFYFNFIHVCSKKIPSILVIHCIHISCSFTSMILIDMKFFNIAVGMMFILSTQHTLNNLISTTHAISNLSTQLSHPKSSGYVSVQYNKQKIREPEQFFQTVPTPGNPLFSALFRYSIFPPLTSTRHTPHVILRLFRKLVYKCSKALFREISTIISLYRPLFF